MIKICTKIFSLFLILSFILYFLSLNFLIKEYKLILEWEIFSFNGTMIMMVVLLDWMSLMFMSFVLFISSLVIFYSEEYMSGDLMLERFILLVVMFVISMTLLIISPNLIPILLGWDGLGLVSYCLVIYYQNIRSFNAGMLTALSNRIGDVALLIAIAWMMNFGSWNFIFYLDLMKNDFFMMLVSYLVILAAMTKSAQIPFSSWLPAAMAAPTPVSSLVHSSTLVTAGVYLLIRFNFCLSENTLILLLFISMFTMFMSGVGANFEFDLKKIIALSTLSQLGLMLAILSLGGYILAFMHLLTHALFKALLFMCAGSIIHNLNNCQDIRFMGSLTNHMPLTCAYFNICNFSLCGLPFLSGFYSKDLIVEFMSMNYVNSFVYLIFYLSIGLTVSYSMRLMYYSLVGSQNFNSLNMIADQSLIMLKGMSGLILLVIFMGSTLNWLIFSNPIFICLSLFMKCMTLTMILMGYFIGNEFSQFKLTYKLKSTQFLNLNLFFSSMWNMPILSTWGVNYYFIYLGNFYYKNLDQGWLEYYGAKNLSIYLNYLSSMFQLLSKNHLKIYLMVMILLSFLFNIY
uniref:NADH-ubiquinone oxidoreductase chain 5 n=1 Tax=Crioceris duodecimpunctata TaxID=184539 RepID=Q8WB14_CRIDU|nr:NADH dehydrogenase subunit 5 [Crioceris duodecimpunctata]AAL67868.1 NADH dehydrogenase subunit 5 [Crioceris duodecimpunctata]